MYAIAGRAKSYLVVVVVVGCMFAGELRSARDSVSFFGGEKCWARVVTFQWRAVPECS